MPAHVYLRRNCQPFLIVPHWSYSKCRDILHTLNVYKIPGKELVVLLCWAADEISVFKILFPKYLKYVLLVLGKYKKEKISTFPISSFLSVQYVLVTTE